MVFEEDICDEIYLVRVEWRQAGGRENKEGNLEEFIGERRYAKFMNSADSIREFDYVNNIRGKIIWLHYYAEHNPWSEHKLKLSWKQFLSLNKPFSLRRRGRINYSPVD